MMSFLLNDVISIKTNLKLFFFLPQLDFCTLSARIMFVLPQPKGCLKMYMGTPPFFFLATITKSNNFSTFKFASTDDEILPEKGLLKGKEFVRGGNTSRVVHTCEGRQNEKWQSCFPWKCNYLP